MERFLRGTGNIPFSSVSETLARQSTPSISKKPSTKSLTETIKAVFKPKTLIALAVAGTLLIALLIVLSLVLALNYTEPVKTVSHPLAEVSINITAVVLPS